MRISTSALYSANVTYLNNLQVQIAHTQQQISTGKRILNPADDPTGAARAIELTLTASTNTQYTTNRTAATNTLSLTDGVLESVTSLIQNLQTTAVTAGGANITDTDRKALAKDVLSNLQDLLGLSNSTDAAGSYLFSGGQGKVQPFINTTSGVVYQGDDVQRLVQVSSSRQLSITDSGADIFMRVRNGNGTFQTTASSTNTGAGIISQGVVTDATQYSGNNYRVTFSVAAGVTTYSIDDMTSGSPVAVTGQTNVPYVSGQAISFNGIQFEMTGAPANGDTFNVAPSTNQSIFDTLNNLISTLNISVPSGNAVAAAQFNQGLNQAIASLSQGLNAVLGVRATVGSRLNELDSLQATGDELNLQYTQTLSKVQDTDYNQALTDLAQQQLVLQAAQQSFAKVSQLSLFNYL